ncbi:MULTISPECIES: ImmA/IrrE family metallo-endopeptidase [unclassified Novosphingobium]|uniref:ImmA/IrrE family metallo-endopeptidase n=1 Tax=unclassified Novosphingobium TaxID=2644732 RepID=UPI00135A88B9|nr:MULTISPECIES: ImmA/IrrE family metallo-endopeptidase [unclassified Novosphingobium]
MKNAALLKDLANCASPETLLAAILRHYPQLSAPIDVEAIARSAGITEFHDLDAQGAASALMADIAKTQGIISTAAGISAPRRRFAIAHQLGHFLIKAQRGDRHCTARDLAENRRDTPRRKEEMQANRFAAGLLMPKPLFARFVTDLGKPTVTHLPTIAAAYGVTLEAAVSRYADLTQTTCAFVFIKDGTIRFTRPSRSFPALCVRSGDTAPEAVGAAGADDGTAWASADVRDWLTIARDVRQPKLAFQTLRKANGFQLVMLFVDAAAERRADEEAEKQANERPRFGR